MNLLHNSWLILHDLSPWLLLGVVVSILIHKFLPNGFVSKHLRGYSGIIKSVFFGIPLPLCSCGVIPAGIGLKRDGSSDGSAVGFLISTPQTGVDSILVASSFLGWPFAIFKVAAAAVTGIIGGGLVEWLKPTVVTNSSSYTSSHEVQSSDSVITWKASLEHGVQLLRSIWTWLLFGVLLSAGIELLITPEDLEFLLRFGPIGTAALALTLSVPLYVCATASVPIAAALVANGFPLSAALIFLMAGPATNVATIGAIRQEFGTNVTAIYLGTVIIGSTVLGLGFDFLLTSSVTATEHEHGPVWWSTISVVLLLVSCACPPCVIYSRPSRACPDSFCLLSSCAR